MASPPQRLHDALGQNRPVPRRFRNRLEVLLPVSNAARIRQTTLFKRRLRQPGMGFDEIPCRALRAIHAYPSRVAAARRR